MLVVAVLAGCMSPRQAQIYPHADSTTTLPVYVLLISRGGLTHKDITLWPPICEEYFKLTGQRPVYTAGDFTWLRENNRKQPGGSITVEWASRRIRVDTSGVHLYDGEYSNVSISPELLQTDAGTMEESE